jgi:hypothetical protein
MVDEAKKKPVMAAVKNLNEGRNQALVAILQEYTKLVEEGHLSDLAIIGKVRGEPMTEFAWDSDNPLELIGALEMAKVEVTSQILAEAMGEDGDDED